MLILLIKKKIKQESNLKRRNIQKKHKTVLILNLCLTYKQSPQTTKKNVLDNSIY